MDQLAAMIAEQIKKRGINDQTVLDTLQKIDRALFVPDNLKKFAYEDHPIPIGFGQTISQPFIVALMTQLCALTGEEKVLEIGTGSGYQAAILAQLSKHLFTIERIPTLAEMARKRLSLLSIENVTVITGDGYLGLEQEAPFDRIIITAAPPTIPKTLIEQLREGGILISPEGTGIQQLVRITKKTNSIKKENLLAVSFVPMVSAQK